MCCFPLWQKIIDVKRGLNSSHAWDPTGLSSSRIGKFDFQWRVEPADRPSPSRYTLESQLSSFTPCALKREEDWPSQSSPTVSFSSLFSLSAHTDARSHNQKPDGLLWSFPFDPVGFLPQVMIGRHKLPLPQEPSITRRYILGPGLHCEHRQSSLLTRSTTTSKFYS